MTRPIEVASGQARHADRNATGMNALAECASRCPHVCFNRLLRDRYPKLPCSSNGNRCDIRGGVDLESDGRKPPDGAAHVQLDDGFDSDKPCRQPRCIEFPTNASPAYHGSQYL